MLPDRVSNPGPLTYESGALPIALRGPAASLCNQLLPGFASNQFETLHRCYKHNEDVHVTFSKQENHF